MDNFLVWAFLGLTAQPCVRYFLVSFSTQQFVFCVSKFRVVGKDQGHLPDLTKLQELQSGHTAGLYSPALTCSEQFPGAACERQDRRGRTRATKEKPEDSMFS